MSLRIRRVSGTEAKSFVDDFYGQNGGRTEARPGDLFFLVFDEETLVGSVRFCLEEGVPMLRGMMIHREKRQQKIGLRLLNAFESFLEQEGIRLTHCLPYDYLEKFYERIGFKRVGEDETPAFLRARMAEYNLKPTKVICMRRD